MSYDDLKTKHKIFVDKYIDSFDPRQSAEEAGYAPMYGYKLAERLKSEIIEKVERDAVDREEVLSRMADIARGDMGEFLKVDEEGNVKVDLKNAEGKTHLIKSIRESGWGWKIELYDAQRALEQIGRILGLYRHRVEFTTEDVEELARNVVNVIDREISDPELKERIFKGLGFED